jgi:hypothetical protein
MVSQIMIQKSSAKHLATRRFSQKGFVDLDFGHRSCPFPGKNSSLVQIRIEKITKLMYAIMGKKEEHNGLIKHAPEKSEFLGRNIYDMWPASKTEFAYFGFKTKIGAA